MTGPGSLRRFLLLAAIALSGWACGGSSAGSTTAGSAAAPATRSSNRDIITREEIEAHPGVQNALDLVRRIRPNFLRVEGRTSMRTVPQSPLVRLDGSVLGDVNSLQGLSLNTVQEIRYYSIVEAETRWSGDRGRPVIAVTSRKLP